MAQLVKVGFHSAMPSILVGRQKTKTKADTTTTAVGDEGCIDRRKRTPAAEARNHIGI